MKLLALAIRQFRREWRGGGLGVLFSAVLIAAAAMAAVGAFSDRVERALAASANELLGADLVIGARSPLDPIWQEQAQVAGLDAVRTVEFPSVVFGPSGSLLVQVKAVEAGYPLRGALEVSDGLDRTPESVRASPGPGAVWVDPRVAVELGLSMGQRLELGDIQPRVTRLITLEPDRGSGVFNLAPRVMMAWDDLDGAALLGPGSRARHRLLISGTADGVERFRARVEPELEGRAQLQTLEESQTQVAGALDRAARFLALAALTAVILAGVAIMLSARQFAERHLDTVAILRCLGLTVREVLQVFIVELLALGVLAGSLGIVLGYLAQELLVLGMADVIPESLPWPSLQPAGVALFTALLVMLGFGLPPVLRLGGVPPVRVLNRQLGALPPAHALRYAPTLLLVAGLVHWLAGDTRLGWIVLGGLTGLALAGAASAWLAIRAAERLRHRMSRGGMRLGLAALARHQSLTIVQVLGLGSGLTALLLLGVVQGDLLASWRASIPENAPNYFVLNIQQQQAPEIRQRLQEAGVQTQGLFPMATGRIIAVNDEDPGERTGGRSDGTINLSWSESLPRANEVIAGQFGPGLSVDSRWAERNGLALGDRVRMEFGATQVELEVTSLREVDWDSFEVNFFLLGSGPFERPPHAYLASIYVPAGDFTAVGSIVRGFANVSVIDIGQILERVRRIIERVTLTIQIVFAFTLAAGVTVLLAALQSGLPERIHEGAIMRTLGARRDQLVRSTWTEFGAIGLIAGTLSAAAALITGQLLAAEVFDIAYQGSWWLIPIAALGTAGGLALLGQWGSRAVIRTPPVIVLRQ